MESTFSFASGQNQLLGIIHQPDSAFSIGILIIVGGPQYRVGSHRQFVLLARDLATNGYPVMRFDYAGMGDSEGYDANFENCNLDIKNAIDAFVEREPTIKKIVLWGLCDAASASLFYAYSDERVEGMVLLNPWVRTESGMAKAYVKHYYLRRLMSGEFWGKIVSGKFNILESVRSLFSLLTKMTGNSGSSSSAIDEEKLTLPDRMLLGLTNFQKPIVFILSGNNDYVADEFKDVVSSSKSWKNQLTRKNVDWIDSPDSDHTFSRKVWRDQVAVWTRDWIGKNL